MRPAKKANKPASAKALEQERGLLVGAGERGRCPQEGELGAAKMEGTAHHTGLRGSGRSLDFRLSAMREF